MVQTAWPTEITIGLSYYNNHNYINTLVTELDKFANVSLVGFNEEGNVQTFHTNSESPHALEATIKELCFLNKDKKYNMSKLIKHVAENAQKDGLYSENESRKILMMTFDEHQRVGETCELRKALGSLLRQGMFDFFGKIVLYPLIA